MVLLLPGVMTVFVSRVLPTLLAIFLCWEGATIPFVQGISNSTTVSSVNSSSSNTSTENKTTVEGNMESPTDTKGLLERSLYVAVGISAIVAIYFIIRTIKTRGKRKSKRYGVIHGAADMEMQPLDKHVDEDDEDVTVFDVNGRKQPK